jgi:hypothetical protein
MLIPAFGTHQTAGTWADGNLGSQRHGSLYEIVALEWSELSVR